MFAVCVCFGVWLPSVDCALGVCLVCAGCVLGVLDIPWLCVDCLVIGWWLVGVLSLLVVVGCVLMVLVVYWDCAGCVFVVCCLGVGLCDVSLCVCVLERASVCRFGLAWFGLV